MQASLPHGPHSRHHPPGLLPGRVGKDEQCYQRFFWFLLISEHRTFGSFGFCLNSIRSVMFWIKSNFIMGDSDLPEEKQCPQPRISLIYHSQNSMSPFPMLNCTMDFPPFPDNRADRPSGSLITSAVMWTQFWWKFSWANKTRSVFMPEDNKISWKRSSLLLTYRIRLSLIARNYLLQKGKRCTEELLTIWGTGTA